LWLRGESREGHLRLPLIEDEAGPEKPEQFPNAGRAHNRGFDDVSREARGGSADQVAGFSWLPSTRVASGPGLAACDHQLHEVKFTDAIGATASRPAQPEEIRELLGASAGSLVASV